MEFPAVRLETCAFIVVSSTDRYTLPTAKRDDWRFSMRGVTSERQLTFGADVFNTTNRVNYAAYVGTIGSPLFLFLARFKF